LLENESSHAERQCESFFQVRHHLQRFYRTLFLEGGSKEYQVPVDTLHHKRKRGQVLTFNVLSKISMNDENEGKFLSCHPRESGDPEKLINTWIPAFAGMTPYS